MKPSLGELGPAKRRMEIETPSPTTPQETTEPSPSQIRPEQMKIKTQPEFRESLNVFDQFDGEFRRLEKDMKRMRKSMFDHFRGYESRLF